MPSRIWNLINYLVLTHVPDKHYSVQLGWLAYFIKNVPYLSSPWFMTFLTFGMDHISPLLTPEVIRGIDKKTGHSEQKYWAYIAHHDLPCFGICLTNLDMLAVRYCCLQSHFQRRMFGWLFMPRTKWMNAIVGYILLYNTISKTDKKLCLISICFIALCFGFGLSLGR